MKNRFEIYYTLWVNGVEGSTHYASIADARVDGRRMVGNVEIHKIRTTVESILVERIDSIKSAI